VILREIIPVLIACSCFSSTALAQKVPPDSSPLAVPSVVEVHDFSKTVLPITELKFGFGLEAKFGTGFCLDPDCRFIGTNYHVAVAARPYKIKGQKVIQRYLATGPDDEGATVNEGPSVSPMKYNLGRDLAIFELAHALTHHHGLAFSLDDLQVGQEIEIYAYPKEPINPIRHLVQLHGKFKGEVTTGLLAFDYSLSADKTIRVGASGGIVVDSRTQRIVGILNGIARNGETVALAVPVQSLVEFVNQVQPYLAQTLFPSMKRISPVSEDLYPKFVPSRIGALQHRPEESPEVKLLRSKAQLLADKMRNFIAVQTFAWGSGDREPVALAAYEVRIVDGYQRFREYPDGNQEFRDVPFPPLNTMIVPGGEWSELPEMVGTRLRLKIHKAPDAVVNERRMKVFQYRADIEDEVCTFRSILDFVFFGMSKTVTVACYGEVWTDEETNILRMSEHYELPGKWKDYQAVVTYGWLQRPDKTPQLIPLTISTQAEYKKKIYWCHGHFTDYRMFGTRVRIIGN
jgi:trypsin-like peptidase